MNYAETENLIQARKREDGKPDTSEDGKPDTCTYHHARINLQHHSGIVSWLSWSWGEGFDHDQVSGFEVVAAQFMCNASTLTRPRRLGRGIHLAHAGLLSILG